MRGCRSLSAPASVEIATKEAIPYTNNIKRAMIPIGISRQGFFCRVPKALNWIVHSSPLWAQVSSSDSTGASMFD